MLNQDHHTKNGLQSKEKRYTLLPFDLFCDNNITYREKSLLLALFLHRTQSIKEVRYIHLSSIALRWSDFKTNTPSRKLLAALRGLQDMGYISLIDDKYAVINPNLYKSSPMIAANSALFFEKKVGFSKLLLLFWLSCRNATQHNCASFIATKLTIDRNTVSKYLKELEALGLVAPSVQEVNGKISNNYHILNKYRPIFARKRKHVDNPAENPVEDFVPISAQINYNFKKIINRFFVTAKLEKIKFEMFTLSQIVDSNASEVERLIKAVKSNLYFKNKLVSIEEIKEKLKELYLEHEKNNVIKVFNSHAHFINFTSMLFKTTSYPIEKALSDLDLLKDIQREVFEDKGEKYSIDFIKWLATKVFARDFVIYHVNIFKNRMIEALLNEKRLGEETDRWSEESYIDWDEVHRQEKLKYCRF